MSDNRDKPKSDQDYKNNPNIKLGDIDLLDDVVIAEGWVSFEIYDKDIDELKKERGAALARIAQLETENRRLKLEIENAAIEKLNDLRGVEINVLKSRVEGLEEALRAVLAQFRGFNGCSLDKARKALKGGGEK